MPDTFLKCFVGFFALKHDYDTYRPFDRLKHIGLHFQPQNIAQIGPVTAEIAPTRFFWAQTYIPVPLEPGKKSGLFSLDSLFDA